MKTPEIVSAQKIFEWLRLQKFQREHGEQEYTMIYEIDLPKIINKFLNDHPSFQPPVEEGEKYNRPIEELFVEEYFGLSKVKETDIIEGADYGQLVNLLTSFKEKYIEESVKEVSKEGEKDNIEEAIKGDIKDCITQYSNYYSNEVVQIITDRLMRYYEITRKP